MIYTTYFANASNIPEGVMKFAISNYLPNGLRGFNHLKQLAPDKEMFHEYKNGNITKQALFEHYNTQLERVDVKRVLKLIMEYVENGKDICFVCYEKEDCHRSILAQWLNNKGMEVKELEQNINRNVK